MSDWFRGTDLDEMDYQVWEEKVRGALYAEGNRERADVERKRLKEEGPRARIVTETSKPAPTEAGPRVQEFTDEDGLD